MPSLFSPRRLAVVLVVAAGTATICASRTVAQNSNMENDPNAAPLQPASVANDMSATDKLLQTPWVKNIPGTTASAPPMENPMKSIGGSVERGMKYYIGFNCAGCHGPNGGGAMGPSLSNKNLFRFGRQAAQHYLVISHGGPTGMPAWGDVLPHDAIWDIVAYIHSISQQPSHSWGETANPNLHEPAIQEQPYEFVQTAHPWQHTQPMIAAQKRTDHPPDAKQNVTSLPD